MTLLYGDHRSGSRRGVNIHIRGAALKNCGQTKQPPHLSRGELDLKLKSKWRSGDFDDSWDKDWLTLAVSLFHPSLSCSIDPTSINQHPAQQQPEKRPVLHSGAARLNYAPFLPSSLFRSPHMLTSFRGHSTHSQPSQPETSRTSQSMPFLARSP